MHETREVEKVKKAEKRRQEAGNGRQKSEVRMERERSKTFQDLVVWQKAHQFVLSVYSFSRAFPKEELYGLTSQLRRAAVSIPANIEGFKKAGKPDKCRFMNIAQGSVEECRYYLILAKDIDYGDTSMLASQIEEISKLLTSYIKSIQTSSS